MTYHMAIITNQDDETVVVVVDAPDTQAVDDILRHRSLAARHGTIVSVACDPANVIASKALCRLLDFAATEWAYQAPACNTPVVWAPSHGWIVADGDVLTVIGLDADDYDLYPEDGYEDRKTAILLVRALLTGLGADVQPYTAEDGE